METSTQAPFPESNSSEVAQTPAGSPQTPAAEPLSPKKTSNNWTILLLAGFVAISLGIAAYFAYQNHQLRQESLQIQSTPITASLDSTTTSSPTSATSSSTPELENPTLNWETYQVAEFTFKYPPGWSTNRTSLDYFGGETVVIKNAEESVTITVYPAINNTFPFGFGNPSVEESPIEISLGEIKYNTTEFVVDNRAAYVNVVNDGDYSFFFGTGYPSGSDEHASLADYFRDKETIKQILSTFRMILPAAS